MDLAFGLLKSEVAVIHDFLIPKTGCAGELSPAPGFCRGSVTILCTLYRPTTGGRHFSLAREGGVNAAQFGVARFSGGSSWKIPEAPADEGGHPRFWMARLVSGTGSPFGAPEPPLYE